MLSNLEQLQSLPHAFFAAVKATPTGVVWRQSIIGDLASPAKSERTWATLSFAQAAEAVLRLASFLKEKGVSYGNSVAIVSNSRPEWLLADMAVLTLGAISVSVYQSLTADEIGFILSDSESRAVFVENQEQLAKILDLRDRDCTLAATEETAARTARIAVPLVISFEEVEPAPGVYSFKDILRDQRSIVTGPEESLTRRDLATLVYTSGTTGVPKGVMQTHGNHLSNIRQARNADIYDEKSSIFLLLPLAHSFAKLMGYIVLTTEAVLAFPAVTNPKSSRPDLASVTRDLRESGCNTIPVVPRILEKMQAEVEKRARAPGPSGLLVRCLLWASVQRESSLVAQLVFRALEGVRQKLGAALFGPEFRCAISGGAKLPVPVGRFFANLGFEVLEGYGLTETCVATNVNRRGQNRIGTVGPVLDRDIEIRFGADGEILYRGPNVAVGYFRRPTATKEAWDAEGWFHTGDLGELDAEGCLRITGRKKELIVTSGGKKIAPEPIENEIKRCPFISQAMLYGDEKKFLVALITIDKGVAIHWAQQQGFTVDQNLSSDGNLRKAIEQHINEVNSKLSSYETVKRFFVASEELTLENGLLTPTLKIKRKEVVKRYRDSLESLYTAPQEGARSNEST